MSKRRAKDQNITVAEFKQWLSGVEDMQQAGWIPSEEQWKKIRAKILALSDEVFEEQSAPVQPAYQYQPQQPVYQQPPVYQPAPQQHPRPAQTSLGDELFIPKPSAADQAFDQGQNLSNPGVTQFG